MPHSATPFKVDTTRTEDGLGKFNAYLLVDANGKTIADTMNSDVAVVHEDFADRPVHRWDEQGRQDMEFIARACNAHAKLIAKCEHLHEVLRLQPKPELGEWNWPAMAEDLRKVIDEAKGT